MSKENMMWKRNEKNCNFTHANLMTLLTQEISPPPVSSHFQTNDDQHLNVTSKILTNVLNEIFLSLENEESLSWRHKKGEKKKTWQKCLYNVLKFDAYPRHLLCMTFTNSYCWTACCSDISLSLTFLFTPSLFLCFICSMIYKMSSLLNLTMSMFFGFICWMNSLPTNGPLLQFFWDLFENLQYFAVLAFLIWHSCFWIHFS